MIPTGPDPLADLRALLNEGRYQEVLDRHARGLAQEPAPEPGLALAVATAATRLGRLHDGENLARSALARFRSRADDDGRMRALNLLGAIAFERGQLTEAVTQWNGTLELARAFGDAQMEARASNNLASAFYLTGNRADAESLYRRALLAYQRLGDRRGVAETCHNLAMLYRQGDDLPRADDSDAEALRHAELVGDPTLLALVVTGRAETHVEEGDLELADEELDRGERLAREAGDLVGVAEVDRVRAARLLKLGRPNEALDFALGARSRAEEFGSSQLQGECAALCAEALRRLGRSTEADVRQREAERIFRALGALGHLRRLGLEP